jgi:hypothetical protein
MNQLRTIKAPIRQVGIFTIRDDGEDLPKQAPALIPPGAVKRVVRARGEEQQIPQVEIYIDDQGLAGQEEASERLVSKAMREAKRRVGSRKEVAEIEKALLEKKVEKEITKEQVVEEVDKGVIKKKIKRKEETAIVPFAGETEEMKLKKAELKTEKAKAKARKAQAETLQEMIRSQTYLQFANARAKDLQKEKGISFKDAKKEATDEYNMYKSSKVSGYITEAGEKSSSGKSKKKATLKVEDFVSEGNVSVASSKKSAKKEEPKLPGKKAEPKEEVKLVSRTKEEAKERRKGKEDKMATQRQIIDFVKDMDDDILEEEYRKIHPRKALPSRLKMENVLIKKAGGRIKGGKYVYGTSEESS